MTESVAPDVARFARGWVASHTRGELNEGTFVPRPESV